jgi:peptidoglycan/xylan/chitin deacetylase (PgdA/CDA1 family)
MMARRSIGVRCIPTWAAIGAALLFAASNASASNSACHTDSAGPAATRIVAVPTTGGPAYGNMQYRQTVPLGPKEVALTFDDGPDPETTRRVLDILDRHCIKATFFMVGYYAEKHPEIVREVAARGHVIGTHTWLHPNSLRRYSLAQAQREIRRGFEAVEAALASAPAKDRKRLAPFFRFPGLNDSAALIRWLGVRHVATFSCEFGADDWKPIGSAEVRRRAIRNIASVGRGILILHDTKPRTADMLSSFITTMRDQGYSFVQLAPEAESRKRAAAAPGALIGAVEPIAVADVEPVLEPNATLR